MMVDRVKDVTQFFQAHNKNSSTHSSGFSVKKGESPVTRLVQGLNQSLLNMTQTTERSAYSLGDKKYELQNGNDQILNVLKTVQMFQGMHATKQRDIQQAILSLVTAFKAASDTFDENLKRLRNRKYRLGQRVKKSSESNQS